MAPSVWSERLDPVTRGEVVERGRAPVEGAAGGLGGGRSSWGRCRRSRSARRPRRCARALRTGPSYCLSSAATEGRAPAPCERHGEGRDAEADGFTGTIPRRSRTPPSRSGEGGEQRQRPHQQPCSGPAGSWRATPIPAVSDRSGDERPAAGGDRNCQAERAGGEDHERVEAPNGTRDERSGGKRP